MTQFLDLLALGSVQRAAFALLLGAIGLPIVDVIIIGLDIVPVRFAMMHIALLGIAIGLLTGIDPLLCAVVACGLSGAGLAPLSRSSSGLSGAMGPLMSLAIAAALLLAGFTLALLLDQPPGPVLVLLAGAVALVAHLIPERRTNAWQSSPHEARAASPH